MRRSKSDNILFLFSILVAEFVALHGKAMSSFLFAGNHTLFRKISNPFFVYFILVLSGIIYIYIRNAKWKPSVKLIVGAVVGVVATVCMQLKDNGSSLILFLQLFIYASATGILWIEIYFDLPLEKDFWKFMFENVFKSVRYILVVYGVMVVVLKYISSKNGENTVGFITTLSYPTGIVLGVIFMIGYWVLLPSWEKYVDASKVNNNRIIESSKSEKRATDTKHYT